MSRLRREYATTIMLLNLILYFVFYETTATQVLTVNATKEIYANADWLPVFDEFHTSTSFACEASVTTQVGDGSSCSRSSCSTCYTECVASVSTQVGVGSSGSTCFSARETSVSTQVDDESNDGTSGSTNLIPCELSVSTQLGDEPSCASSFFACETSLSTILGDGSSEGSIETSVATGVCEFYRLQGDKQDAHLIPFLYTSSGICCLEDSFTAGKFGLYDIDCYVNINNHRLQFVGGPCICYCFVKHGLLIPFLHVYDSAKRETCDFVASTFETFETEWERKRSELICIATPGCLDGSEVVDFDFTVVEKGIRVPVWGLCEVPLGSSVWWSFYLEETHVVTSGCGLVWAGIGVFLFRDGVTKRHGKGTEEKRRLCGKQLAGGSPFLEEY